MVDLYIDDVSLKEVRAVGNEQELLFSNSKDEIIHIPVNNEELLNILDRVRMRCETLDLIYAVDIKRKRDSK